MPNPDNKTAPFFEAARAFYADAFEHRRKKDLAAAMGEWSELNRSEQSFAVAHLLYLNLQAHAATHRLLTRACDLLDEIAEGIGAIEGALPPEPSGDPDPDAETDEPNEDPAFDADAANSDPDGVRVAPAPGDAPPLEPSLAQQEQDLDDALRAALHGDPDDEERATTGDPNDAERDGGAT